MREYCSLLASIEDGPDYDIDFGEIKSDHDDHDQWYLEHDEPSCKFEAATDSIVCTIEPLK